MNNFQTFYYTLYIICAEVIFLLIGYICCFHLSISPLKEYPLGNSENETEYLKRRFWKVYFLFLYGMMTVTLIICLLILVIHSVKGW